MKTPTLPRRPRRTLPALILLTGPLALVSSADALHAQDDVTMLGLRHGTTPPAAYYERLRQDPEAFQFARGWMRRNPRLRVTEVPGSASPRPRVEIVASSSTGVPPTARSTTDPEGVLGRREGGVQGTFAFPLVLGLFSDFTSQPPTRSRIQQEFFDGPSTRKGTVPEFYAEISGGRVDLVGESHGWARSSLTQAQVTGGSSGLGSGSRIGDFIIGLVQNLDDGTIDWGRFDNDGPDGIPNSGDDDGVVDVLAVMHPTPGAECNRDDNRIWSHRWNLYSASGGSIPQTGLPTSSPSANGGTISVLDYTVQPARNCADTDLGDIGVFAHELGHGFGLPDLYCTGDCSGSGIGEWGLMGSGSWGCRGDDPSQPCHMGAWSKEVMGWATVATVPPDTDLGTVSLAPVETGGDILRVDIPGTAEYYLVENRQQLGFDTRLHAPGLVIWHVDETLVNDRWNWNGINATPARYGVRVVEADDQGALRAGADRGDSGDVFPGSLNRTSFHVATSPGSLSHDGVVSGMTLLDLVQTGSEMQFRLLTRFQDVTLASTGDGGAQSLLAVDGELLPPGGGTVPAAPFQTVRVEAAAGEVLEPGTRRSFLRWTDGVADTLRTLTVGLTDTSFVAEYAGLEIQVGMELAGGEFGVVPGSVVSDPPSPGLWYLQGTAVTLEAQATPGFSFVEWTGALAGAPNPVGLVVDAPVAAGATFAFDFAAQVVDPVTVMAGDGVSLTLQTSQATDPVTWSVVAGGFPEGVLLETDGRVTGSPHEVGTFSVTLRARDGQGLEAVAELTLEVGVPDLPLGAMAGGLLGNGTLPTPGQASFLDFSGNRNGRVDTGDIRNYLMNLVPLGTSAPLQSVSRIITVTLGPGGTS